MSQYIYKKKLNNNLQCFKSNIYFLSVKDLCYYVEGKYIYVLICKCNAAELSTYDISRSITLKK